MESCLRANADLLSYSLGQQQKGVRAKRTWKANALTDVSTGTALSCIGAPPAERGSSHGETPPPLSLPLPLCNETASPT